MQWEEHGPYNSMYKYLHTCFSDWAAGTVLRMFIEKCCCALVRMYAENSAACEEGKSGEREAK